MKGIAMAQRFIQMSGAPGAGKSTIAHAIAPHIDAVVQEALTYINGYSGNTAVEHSCSS